MKLFLSLTICLQLISSPLLAAVGERTEETAKSILLNSLTETEARIFEEQVREGLKQVEKKGLNTFLTTSLKDLPAADEKILSDFIASSKNATPLFKEVVPGLWSYKEGSLKLTFNLIGLHQGHIFLNGEKFVIEGLGLAELREKLTNWEPSKKTSSFKTINNLIGIGEAEALIPIVVVGVLAAAFIAYALYNFKYEPEASVKKINEIKKKLEAKAEACESSSESSGGFDQAIELLKPVKKIDDKFEIALKNIISSSAVNGETCYDAAHEAGKAIKTNIPKLSRNQQQTLEERGGGNKSPKSDVAGALYNMCSSFNQLRSCLSTFAAKNINNEQYKNLDNDTKEKLNNIKPGASKQ